MTEIVSQVMGWLLSSLVGGGVVAAAGYALLKDKLIEDILVGDEGYPRLVRKLVLDGVFAKKSALEIEAESRRKADSTRDKEQHRVAELVQQFIGRAEIMERRMEEADRNREREVAKLREEVRTGFARIEEALRRNRSEGNHN